MTSRGDEERRGNAAGPDAGVTRARVLVVTTEALAARAVDLAPELELADKVRVVAPAAKLTPLQWLTNDEQEARAVAAEVAGDTARAVGERGAEVEPEVGDVDPIQAVEDALATFPADELVVVLPGGDEASFLERAAREDGFARFGLPVRCITVGGAPS